MNNGGQVGSRGYIFQSIIALIECLERDDWDEIKNEPKTDEDKVDIMLYREGRILSAIQVKSSISDFQKANVRKWLENLKDDAKGAEKICLCLVGDSFTPSCKSFIETNRNKIKTVPFANIQQESTLKLIEYIKRVGLAEKVRISDLDLIDASLFSEILRNSIAKDPVSYADFATAFQRAIPRGEELEARFIAAVNRLAHNNPAIPQCLTPIPLIDKEIGLVGRDAVVRNIRKMLNENTCIVLVSGLGGIGKTAVMQGVCNELKDEGHHVAWISCGDSLQDDLLMLRDAFGIPKNEKSEEAYSLVKAGIQKLGKKLYIFMDDLSREVSKKERDAINEMGVHVMITSRKDNLPFRKKKIEYLAEQDVIKMFYGYYGAESGCEEAAWKIIESVNSHTLLVELLAKAAREEGGTLDEFYEKLKDDGFFAVSDEELETEHDDENLSIEEIVIRLYKISGLSEEQQRIMKLFTIFSPEKEIYYKIREWAGFDRKELKKLVDLGWLERSGLENGYQIHQIVKDSISRQVRKVKLEDYGEFIDKVIDTDGYLGSEITYEKIRARIVLAEDVARFFEDGGREDAGVGALLNNMAVVYDSQGDYGKALEYYRKALAIRERVLGTGHPNTATTYSNIAEVYRAQGYYLEAQEYNGKALAIRERVFGKEHPATATTYNNMAAVYDGQGDYANALEYYGKAISIVENVLGPEHPYTATTYNNIALVYSEKGDYTIALEFYGKALFIYERVFGKEHPATATTYNNMALVYKAQGDFENAIEYYGKALAISERMLGTEHPDTATTYSNMAWLYREQGDFKTAFYYYKKAYDIRKAKLGDNHPYTKSTKCSIEIMESKLK